MKNLFTFLVSIFLLTNQIPCLSQTWTQSGPQGANIVNIQATSTSLFAASYVSNIPGGVFRSLDNGQTWENLTGNFQNKKIRNLWTLQDSIFVSIAGRNIGGNIQADGGAFLSLDNGESWTVLFPNSGLSEPEAFIKKGSYMFFGGLQGLKISNDQGQTWTTSTGGQSGQSYQVKCFEKSGDTLFIGTRKGLFRSLNNGTTWTAASTGIPTTPVGANWITSMTKIGGTLFATSSNKGVYKSTNLGVSWVAANNGITDLKANYIYYTGTELVLGTYYAGIYKSADGGASWTVATLGLPNQSINCFYQNASTLLAGGQDGVYKSIDNGSSWSETNNSLFGNVVGTGKGTATVLAKAGGYLFASTYTGRILRSSDNGSNWEHANGDIRVSGLGYFNALAGNDAVLLAAAYDSKLYQTFDWGNTWTIIPFPEGSAPDHMLSINNRIYGVLYGLVYYTDDNGFTWNNVSAPDGCGTIAKKNGDIFASGGYDGTATHYHQIYKSDNGTNAFIYKGDVIPSGSGITALGTLGDTLFASVSNSSTGAGEGIYWSADDGVTWIFESSLGGSAISSFISDGNLLFARNNFQIFVRNNINGTWMNINSNLPFDDQGFYSSGLIANQGKLFASVSSRSLFTTDISQFTFLPPSQPVAITGSAMPCIGSALTYSVSNVTGVSYTWQLPSGWIITSGNTTNSITVIVGSNPGIILVTPANIYGTGPSQYLVVVPNNNPPSQPSEISGSANPEPGSTQSYNVVNENGVTYSWTYPSDWILTSGGTTNSITLTVGNEAGNITVTPSTPCGSGASRILAVTPLVSFKLLNVTLLLEGLYNSASGVMNPVQGISGPQFAEGIADKVTIELHETNSPFDINTTFTDVDLLVDGSISINTIPGNLNGSYYIVVKHRNSLETWSSAPVSFVATSPISYDFTTDVSQAYGNNLKQEGSVYVIWGGEATQDGIVDGSDMAAIDNASTQVLTGYNPEDVNGDGIVDGSDMALIDNNSTAVIQVMRP